MATPATGKHLPYRIGERLLFSSRHKMSTPPLLDEKRRSLNVSKSCTQSTRHAARSRTALASPFPGLILGCPAAGLFLSLINVKLFANVDTVEELTDILPLDRGRLLDARRCSITLPKSGHTGEILIRHENTGGGMERIETMRENQREKCTHSTESTQPLQPRLPSTGLYHLIRFLATAWSNGGFASKTGNVTELPNAFQRIEGPFKCPRKIHIGHLPQKSPTPTAVEQ